jgi:DHA3 family macrolide efflux protein-like MFS transporter
MATQFSEAENPHWRRPFFTIWIGQAFSLLGSQLVQFALIWYLTDRTGSATVLATASIIGLLPGVLFSPIIGVFVDRWNRRRIMIIADAIVALATLGLVFVFWVGEPHIVHIYLIMFIRSVAGNFHQPAMSSSTSLMVPREQMTRIQGLNQTLNGGLNIVAAPLGAFLMSVIPMQGVIAVDVVTALLAILPLLFIDVPQPARMAGTVRRRFAILNEALDGFKYIYRWTGLLIIILTATLLNFTLAPTFGLLPLLVKSHFQGGAMQLGWIDSVFGVGAVGGALLLTIWGGFRRRIYNVGTAIVGAGVGCLIIGFLPASGYMAALGAIAIVGISIPIANGTLGAIFQATIDPGMQGRVLSSVNSAAQAMMPLGYAIAGPLSDAFGIQIWFVVTGIVCLSMGVAQMIIPAVVYLEERKPEPVIQPLETA